MNAEPPLWQTIRAVLEGELAAGAFPPGMPLPAEKHLAARFGCAIGTVRRAVDELVAARALVRRAPIVILDEPTTGLDPASRALVEDSLWTLTQGRTTLAITHDLSMIRELDRVLWLEDGRIVEDGAPAKLLCRPDTRVARWAAQQRVAAAEHQEESA